MSRHIGTLLGALGLQNRETTPTPRPYSDESFLARPIVPDRSDWRRRLAMTIGFSLR